MVSLELNERLPIPWNSVILAVVAVLCGAIVGIERDKKAKPVGFRTLTLVGLGTDWSQSPAGGSGESPLPQASKYHACINSAEAK
jgi:hypothetical protein